VELSPTSSSYPRGAANNDYPNGRPCSRCHHIRRSWPYRKRADPFSHQEKEREAEWRKLELDHYKEFTAALNDIVGPPAPLEAKVRFASAANNISSAHLPYWSRCVNLGRDS